MPENESRQEFSIRKKVGLSAGQAVKNEVRKGMGRSGGGGGKENDLRDGSRKLSQVMV